MQKRGGINVSCMARMLTGFLVVFLILITPIFAEPSVKISKVGYGETPQEIHIIIENTGDEAITGLNLFLDGEEYKYWV